MHHANPFNSDLALANSCYLAYRDGRLVYAASDQPAPELAAFAHNQFRSMITDPKYPCVGAKSVINTGGYRLGWYGRMGSPEATAGLSRDLFQFVQDQPTLGPKFTSFFTMFQTPNPSNEKHFERLLWRQLQSLHDLDAQFHDWDPGVSADCAHGDFAFSFARRGYFIVGMHAGSTRPDRRFTYPTLVWNAQFMFDGLRAAGQFETFQGKIRGRTQALELTLNPNLANYGEASAARQYSGRHVEHDWVCPLHVHSRQAPTSDPPS